MAAVIHELWMGNDASLMIMPGSVPLDVPNVRDELTRHLFEGWNSLVDQEVTEKIAFHIRKISKISDMGGNQQLVGLLEPLCLVVLLLQEVKM